MNKEFVPYEQALALKELGFDAECVSRFVKSSSGLCKYELRYGNPRKYNSLEFSISRPLYQQAFRFFRNKYNLDGSLSVDVWNTKKVSWRITGGIEGKIFVNNENELYDWESDEFNNYEEAELACLNKLIEIAQKR